MVGSLKKNKTKPAYERSEIDDAQIVENQEKDAATGHDQRQSLLAVIKRAVSDKS